MQKRKRKAKINFKKLIFKTLTYIFGFLCIVSICAVDSEPFWIPLLGVFVFGVIAWFTFCLWLMEEENEGGEA